VSVVPNQVHRPTSCPLRYGGRPAARRSSFSAIGCLLALFALISPRLALFALWLFSDLLSRAFDSWLVPLLGFFLLPWTTLAYAVMWSSADRVAGFEWFIVVLAFFFDVASIANRRRARR
jgi:hypothetical protein